MGTVTTSVNKSLPGKSRICGLLTHFSDPSDFFIYTNRKDFSTKETGWLPRTLERPEDQAGYLNKNKSSLNHATNSQTRRSSTEDAVNTLTCDRTVYNSLNFSPGACTEVPCYSCARSYSSPLPLLPPPGAIHPFPFPRVLRSKIEIQECQSKWPC